MQELLLGVPPLQLIAAAAGLLLAALVLRSLLSGRVPPITVSLESGEPPGAALGLGSTRPCFN